MDQWLQLCSLAALLCIAIMNLYSSYSGVRCWCPAQFTDSHVHYADAFCSDLHTPRYHPLPDGDDTVNPVPRLQPIPYNISKDKTLLKCVGLEALLAFTLYSVIEVLKACVSVDVSLPQGSHRAHSKAPLYVLVQAIGAILWTLFAALTYLAYEEKAVSEALSPFLCQFKMQYQLRLHTYLVQCKDTGGGGIMSAVNANIGLAVIVAFAKVVHIIMCFIVQPRLKRDKMCIKLKEHRMIKDSREMGSCFAMSDLYFAMLVTGADVIAGPNPGANNNIKKI